jgi:hypothetical protein
VCVCVCVGERERERESERERQREREREGVRKTHNILNRLNNTKGRRRLRSFPSGLHKNSNTILSLCNVRKSLTTKRKN